MAKKLSSLTASVTLNVNGWTAGLKQIERDSRAIEKSLKPIGDATKRLGSAFTTAGVAVSAIGLPFVALAKRAIDSADAFSKMSQRTGATVEALSALKLKADLADVSMESLEGAFKKGSVSIENAASGGKAAAESLAKIGLSAEQLLKMSPDERFFAIAKGIAAIEDPSLKAGVAMEIWGKGGTELLTMVDSLKGGLAATIEEAKLFGVVITGDGAKSAERFNDAITLMVKTFGGLLNAVVDSGLLDIFSGLIETIAKATAEFAKAHPWITSVGVAIAALSSIVGPLLIVVGLTASGIAALIPIVSGAAAAIAAVGAPVIAAVAAITLLVGAVAAIGTSIAVFISQNEELRSAAIAAWAEIRAAGIELFNAVSETLVSAAEQIREIWKVVGPDVSASFSFIVKVGVEMIKNFAAAVTTGLKVLTGTIQAFHGLITGDFSKFSAGVQKIWSALWSALVKVITTPLKSMAATVDTFTSSVANKFKAMYEAVVGHSYVPDMIEGIREAFGRLDEVMVDPTRRATNGVLSSFSNMFDTVLGFARDWKGSLKSLMDDIIGGLDLKGILKGDFSSVKESLKDVIGLGGEARSKTGGILGGILGGGDAGVGTSGSAGQVSGLASKLSPIAMGASIANDAFDLVTKITGKIGAGRDSANEIVKAENAFVKQTLAGILADPTLSATNKYKLVSNEFEAFQANLARYSATGGENAVTANQSFASVSPLVSNILRDQIKAGAMTGDGDGGITIQNVYIQLSDVVTPDQLNRWINLDAGGFRTAIITAVDKSEGLVTAH